MSNATDWYKVSCDSYFVTIPSTMFSISQDEIT